MNSFVNLITFDRADVRGMDHIHHNHTYALGSEASGTSQRPVSRDKHRGDSFSRFLSIDFILIEITIGSCCFSC
jgi:hypothetical protein